MEPTTQRAEDVPPGSQGLQLVPIEVTALLTEGPAEHQLHLLQWLRHRVTPAWVDLEPLSVAHLSGWKTQLYIMSVLVDPPRPGKGDGERVERARLEALVVYLRRHSQVWQRLQELMAEQPQEQDASSPAGAMDSTTG